MKVIIAGPRTVNDYSLIPLAIRNAEKHGIRIAEVVSGHARGVDTLGERYAKENGYPLKLFISEWRKYGKSAGPVRNVEMAGYSDALVAIWDGVSKGTKHMIETMRRSSKPVYVLNLLDYKYLEGNGKEGRQ